MPVKLAPAVPLTGAAWPADIPPLLAAAFDRSGTAPVVFEGNLRLRYAVGSLEALLGAESGAFLPCAPLLPLLRKRATTDGPSKALMELTLQKAVDGTVFLETRRIVRNRWMSTFDDITNQPDAELRLSGGLSAGLLQPLDDSYE